MILIPFFVLACTEVLKVIIQSIKHGKFSLKWLLHSGGMPSGHSAFTASIATLVAYMKGYNSPEFLIALGFAIIVMYDARGVRATVGRHATHLNKVLKKNTLEEYVGHTNWEVIVGGSLGIILTVLLIRFASPLFQTLENLIV